jgi:hypothetical protein
LQHTVLYCLRALSTREIKHGGSSEHAANKQGSCSLAKVLGALGHQMVADGGELGHDLGHHLRLSLAQQHLHQRRHPRVQLLQVGAAP